MRWHQRLHVPLFLSSLNLWLSVVHTHGPAKSNEIKVTAKDLALIYKLNAHIKNFIVSEIPPQKTKKHPKTFLTSMPNSTTYLTFPPHCLASSASTSGRTMLNLVLGYTPTAWLISRSLTVEPRRWGYYQQTKKYGISSGMFRIIFAPRLHVSDTCKMCNFWKTIFKA